jgi:hypothetical protein
VLQNSHLAGPTTEIDARATWIEEHVIGVAACCKPFAFLAGGRIEQLHHGRRAEDAGDQGLRGAERHREILAGIARRPARHHPSCVQIDHRDLMRVVDVDVGAAAGWVYFKPFRVRW